METVVILLAVFSASVLAVPEQGKWVIQLDQDHQYKAVAKHMYKGSRVTVAVSLKCEDPDGIEINWMLRMSPCAMEFISATEEINAVSNDPKQQDTVEHYMKKPITRYNLPYDRVEWLDGNSSHTCSDDKDFLLEGIPGQKPHIDVIPNPASNSTEASAAPPPAADSASHTGSGTAAPPPPPAKQGEAEKVPPADAAATPSPAASRKKREEPSVQNNVTPAPQDATKAPSAGTQVSSTAAPGSGTMTKLDHPDVANVWVDGNYLFILRIRPKKESATFKAEVTIRMYYGDENYISAMDYPLLIFYGIMGLVYIVYGLLWLVLLACNWRDLLRVQFWIGGVILLGMLEKAVFFAEYENINKTGQSVHGAVIFAELVSCLKRTLARMLVIIVSLGFGIVKPRLGQAFHKVLFVGGLFFILAAIEGSMRATTIFSSLIQTTRTLRLRRNVVKLTLYRHFTNTLIFAVLASVAYMIWSMTQHKFKQCVKDWKQLWVDEAFWHMLFVLLVLIIMLLWRPTANNQRYAFSPLLDAADEEDDEDAMMNDAFDGMKMRGVKAANGSPKQRDPKSKVEEDLKWVEENIPSSVADKALPTLLDSDEELMTTKFEMSKME